jgi:hypothetical protein
MISMAEGTRDLTRRGLLWGLLAAYSLHLIVLALYVFEIIPQEFHTPEYPFWFHQGGDERGYLALARALVSGNFTAGKYPLGFPILLVPFLWVVQPATRDTLIQPVAAFWSLAMFPLGQLALAWLTVRLTGRRWLTLVSVLLWTALPVVTYIALRLVSNPTFAEASSVHMTWAQMLSDGPATLFTLLTLVVFLAARARGYPLWSVSMLGAVGGFLLLIRLTGILTVGSISLLLVIERRWRAAILMVALALIVFAPQMIYNQYFFGGPLTTGYTVLDDLPPQGLFSLTYLFDALGKLWARLGLLLPVGVLLSVSLLGIGLVRLWQRSRVYALVVGSWLGGYLAFYSVYFYSWNGSLPRFLIPVYPAAAIIGAVVLGYLIQVARRRR